MLGQVLLTLSGLMLIIGPFVADFNATHVLNPRWPPHARFHNGQTMSMGVCLGLATLYYTYRSWQFSRAATPSPADALARADALFTAALFGSIYYVAGLSGVLYPGAAGQDPEFGDGFPQAGLFVTLFIGAWMGWWVETRR